MYITSIFFLEYKIAINTVKNTDMSFTRIRDDTARVQKQLEQQTFSGMYQLNVPGQGDANPFADDVHLRLQRWGANRFTNVAELECDLRGMTRKFNHDLIGQNEHGQYAADAMSLSSTYSTAQPFVEESRASLPAWLFRDAVQPRWETPIVNPQNWTHLSPPFMRDVNTRLVDKDQFVPSAAPRSVDTFDIQYFLPSSTTHV